MSARVGLERQRPRRRTHAERTAETRGAIMRAVVESIAELGFKRTTASEIARRAGVTWGAVQHHFGGKDGILVAVLEDSFARFAARLSDIAPDGLSLERRTDLFVERAWEHFASPHFRSTFEILQHDATPSRDGGWQGQMLAAWDAVWSALFGEAGLSRGRRLALQHYTISVLTGLALLRRFEEPAPALRARELALLKETLLRELAGKAARS
ncbi:MAG TPA: TetR/AcrR family transcriptional regulator [Myxococcota bacterium]|nr:TetR/AcrR family transcriptional regulator [Myxococcota bacterium]